MGELNLKQITDKLNAEFAGEARKLVFWYDENAEFIEDVDTLELDGAKVHHLEPDNQFYTKYLLERLDTESSYLIYASFPKPSVRDNHLEDTLLYSKRFYADRASLLAVDLHIDEKYKPVIQKYIKFFGAKDRTQRFYDLEIENFTEETIEVAIMSALSKTRIASFEEVLRMLLTDDRFEDNKFLAEFEKYDLMSAFWKHCEMQFGYTDVKPTLEKLAVTMFVTYTERYLHADLPASWRSFLSYKSGNIIAFMDNLMNNIVYRKRYDEISAHISTGLKAVAALESYNPEDMVDCDTFAVIDSFILKWIRSRLLREDVGAKLGSLDIPTLCQERIKKHFGALYKQQYLMLSSAFRIISTAKYTCPDGMTEIVKKYIKEDYCVDRYYREFYYAYDQLSDTSEYETLRELVENIYTNEYLAKLLPKWNEAYVADPAMNVLPLQRNFYKDYIKTIKDKTVVIISDALRYETAKSLSKKLQDDPNCTVKIDAMVGVLPSYTRLGMAALLPHKMLDMVDDGKVLVDGLPSNDTKQREALLKRDRSNSRCIQFDDINAMKRDELRKVITGMDVIYVYHNQIDARGDKANTENEVFNACAEAIDEIFSLIKWLSTSANTYHYIVTADHGFIYKRDKLTESDKINYTAGGGTYVNRRFIISNEAIVDHGVASLPLGRVLSNEDTRQVSFPKSSNVFQASGGGQNYVHGGSSPQEMIIPLIDVKTERGRIETRPAQIALVSMVQKITNLITPLDFIQSEPISDIVRTTNYKLFFISEDNEKISNECIYIADKKAVNPQKRIFRLKFTFKDKRYDKTKKYYLVAYDDKNDLEVLRHAVIMDIAFADNFGF